MYRVDLFGSDGIPVATVQGGITNISGRGGMKHSIAERVIVPFEPTTVQQQLLRARTVLVVEAPGVLPLLESDPGRRSVVAAHMSTVGPELMLRVGPQAVVSPLIARGWDILDLGLILADLKFRGTLYAHTRPLPRASLVLRELREACPGVDITLLEMD